MFGYVPLLDITMRGDEDRSFRKSFDTFTPIGPEIVTADEVGDPGALELELRLNGEVRQRASTARPDPRRPAADRAILGGDHARARRPHRHRYARRRGPARAGRRDRPSISGVGHAAHGGGGAWLTCASAATRSSTPSGPTWSPCSRSSPGTVGHVRDEGLLRRPDPQRGGSRHRRSTSRGSTPPPARSPSAGAEPGDSLVAEILAVRPAPTGVATLIPGFGPLAHLVDAPQTQMFEVGEREIRDGGEDRFPAQPMVGVIGVATAGEEVAEPLRRRARRQPRRPLARRRRARSSSRCASPAACSPSATCTRAMGDGEVCFTGVEVAGEVDIRLGLLKGKQSRWPVTELADAGCRTRRRSSTTRRCARCPRRRRACSSTSGGSRSRTRSSSSRLPATSASPRAAARRRARHDRALPDPEDRGVPGAVQDKSGRGSTDSGSTLAQMRRVRQSGRMTEVVVEAAARGRAGVGGRAGARLGGDEGSLRAGLRTPYRERRASFAEFLRLLQEEHEALPDTCFELTDFITGPDRVAFRWASTATDLGPSSTSRRRTAG